MHCFFVQTAHKKLEIPNNFQKWKLSENVRDGKNW